mmetsp:Transcript_9933/g.15309  ORF Transcript_9933/g.15309 Transcript_9933/m.15309 type:complete len:228 (-) Transcript_9933:477-1160(-)
MGTGGFQGHEQSKLPRKPPRSAGLRVPIYNLLLLPHLEELYHLRWELLRSTQTDMRTLLEVRVQMEYRVFFPTQIKVDCNIDHCKVWYNREAILLVACAPQSTLLHLVAPSRGQHTLNNMASHFFDRSSGSLHKLVATASYTYPKHIVRPFQACFGKIVSDHNISCSVFALDILGNSGHPSLYYISIPRMGNNPKRHEWCSPLSPILRVLVLNAKRTCRHCGVAFLQ